MQESLKRKLLSVSYVATAFFALHDFSLYFVLANFLNEYFSKGALSVIFAIGAAISMVAAHFFGKILNKYNNQKTLKAVLILQLGITLFLALSNYLNIYIIAGLFVLRTALLTLIWTSINVFIGEFSEHDNIGAIRGTVLTIYNFGALGTPFAAGQIFNLVGYSGLFTLSAVALLPIIYLTSKFFSQVKEPKYKRTGLRAGFKLVFKDVDLRGVIASSFVLNSFYAVINVYLVLYLTEVLNIPLVLYLELLVPITIIPFILVPYQLGKYSDEIFGEKRAMMLGILTMSLVLISIYVFDIKSTNIFLWIGLVFLARLGATITETENYAYFYKKVDGRSAGLISLFQNMINVSFLSMTLLGAILIDFFNIKLTVMFLIVGIMGLLAMFVIKKIKDSAVKIRKIKAEKERIENILVEEESKKEAEAQKEWKNKEERIWT